MELSVFERGLLLQILTKHGSYTDIGIILDLEKELSFSEAEQSEINMVHRNAIISGPREILENIIDSNVTALSQEQIAQLKFRLTPESVTWDEKLEEKQGPKDIPMGIRALSIIHDTLTELNKKKKLHVSMKTLYEKFVKDSA